MSKKLKKRVKAVEADLTELRVLLIRSMTTRMSDQGVDRLMAAIQNPEVVKENPLQPFLDNMKATHQTALDAAYHVPDFRAPAMVDADEDIPTPEPLIRQADPELEALLKEEELIEQTNAHRLRETLELVSIDIPLYVIDRWSFADRGAVHAWAWQQYLIASDNEFEDDELLAKPGVLINYPPVPVPEPVLGCSCYSDDVIDKECPTHGVVPREG